MTTAHPFRRPLGIPDFERMNLPQAYWRAKVQNVAEEVRPLVARYLLKMDQMVENGVGMIVLGEPGVGKTGIAALVAKEARSRGYVVMFTSVWELRELIRAKVRFDDELSMMQRAADVPVLIWTTCVPTMCPRVGSDAPKWRRWSPSGPRSANSRWSRPR